jgi:subtilase family serine protease
MKGVTFLNLSLRSHHQRQTLRLLIALAFLLGLLPMLGATALAASRAHSGALAVPFGGKSFKLALKGTQAPPDSLCRADFSVPCYSPQEIRNAYGLTPVINAGFTGKGQTIVIIDSFGSPTLASDLATFDEGYGLPDPPSLKVLSPLGTVPFDPNNSDMVGWAAETTLDVEWAHAMAPGASIVLMTSPVSETQGVQGMPQFLFLEQYALNHHLGKIISQSWGTTENTLFDKPGRAVLSSFEQFYERAAAEHVTVLASAGDAGTANPDVNGNIFPFPTVNFPASSPWVTAVGGTSLFADTNGNYQSETVWGYPPNGGATGGGVSQVFGEPDYQSDNLNKADQKLVDHHRGLPDIAYNADPNTSILIYLSFLGPSAAGYYFIGGTSEGSPQWAGLIADANQWARRPLGFINDALYAIGNSGLRGSAYHDVTVGNNSQDNLPGYSATPGWDAATGWGSPKAARLLFDLIVLTAR